MGVLSWIVFWPDAPVSPLLFHLFRHVCTVAFVVLATHINPSLFTVYLMLLSIIEYTRRCRLRSLVCLYFTFTLALWLSDYLSGQFVPSTPRAVVLGLLRSGNGFGHFVVDHITVKRFGSASLMSTVAFGFLVAAGCEFQSVIDPVGVTRHMSALCRDFPALTLSTTRIAGPGGVAFVIGLLAAYTSQWRLARLMPRFMAVLVFQVVPVVGIVQAVAVNAAGGREWFVRATVVRDAATFMCAPRSRSDLVVFAGAIDGVTNATSALEELAKATGAVVAFAHVLDGMRTVSVVRPDGEVMRRTLSPPDRKVPPVRVKLEDMLSFKWRGLGRLGFVAGREMHRPEYFTARDVDLLVTFDGIENDELSGAARRAAVLVSQMTGAARLHASVEGETFAVGADGVFQFRDVTDESVSREYDIAVAKNNWRWNGVRHLVSAFIITTIGFAIVVMNLMRRRNVLSFMLSMDELFVDAARVCKE